MINYKGIYFDDDQGQKFQCPETGAHFEYLDMYRRLKKVYSQRLKQDKLDQQEAEMVKARDLSRETGEGAAKAKVYKQNEMALNVTQEGSNETSQPREMINKLGQRQSQSLNQNQINQKKMQMSAQMKKGSNIQIINQGNNINLTNQNGKAHYSKIRNMSNDNQVIGT